MSDLTFRTFLKDIDNNNIMLPSFQREFEWDEEAQRQFIASLIIGLPVGSFLFLNTNQKQYSNKDICFKESSSNNYEDVGEFKYLLDGQQRISVLKSVFTPLIKNNKEEFTNIYYNLRYIWFLKIKPNEISNDIFGFKKLQFEYYENDEEKDKIRTLIPEDIIDNIIVKRIFKTKSDWYNPISDDYETRDFVKECAKRFLIPLSSITVTEGRPLHIQVLSDIKNDLVERYLNYKSQGDIIKDDISINWEHIDDQLDSNYSDLEKPKDMVSEYIQENFIGKLKEFLNHILSKEAIFDERDDSDLPRAISIFEHINLGGQHLDTFDIIVAKACRVDQFSDVNLTSRLRTYLKKPIEIPSFLNSKYNNSDIFLKFGAITKNDKLNNPIVKQQFLKLLSLLKYKEEEIIDGAILKSKEILTLTADDIVSNWESAIKGVQRSCIFFIDRLGTSDITDIPYNLMFLPIAFVFCNDDFWEDQNIWDKLEYWYWITIFRGFYSTNQTSRNVIDLNNIKKSIINGTMDYKEIYNEGEVEDIFTDTSYNDKEILTLKNADYDIYPSKNIEKLILNYILAQHPRDFQKLEEERKLSALKIVLDKNEVDQSFKVDKHHIIPVSRYIKDEEEDEKLVKNIIKDIRGDKDNLLNSPLNLTYILSETNKKISNQKPSDYFNSYFTDDNFYRITRDHYIPENVKNIDEIDEDKINDFLNDRFDKITGNIKDYLLELYREMSD